MTLQPVDLPSSGRVKVAALPQSVIGDQFAKVCISPCVAEELGERSDENKCGPVLGFDADDLENAPTSVRAAVLGKGASSRSVDMRGGQPDVETAVQDVERASFEKNSEGVVDFEEDESVQRKMRMPKLAYVPSREEVRRHRLTHCPYRSWCEECVCVVLRIWTDIRRGANLLVTSQSFIAIMLSSATPRLRKRGQ